MFYNNEEMFHADELMFYTNILILLSIFVEKEGGGTEGVDDFTMCEQPCF